MNVIVKRSDRNNLGDWMANPADYFDLGPCRVHDIHDTVSLSGVKRVIIGGGGMFHFGNYVNAIFNVAGNLPVIGWGIGTNRHDVQDADYGGVDFKKFRLLGLRDKGAEDFVPCVSAMHPALVHKKGFGVVTYQHKDNRHNLSKIGFPFMTNDCQDFSRVIRFLQSAETVITSAYHGYYWSVLLGKKVILYKPFSSKFHYVPWPVTIVNSPDELRDALTQPQPTYPDALAECRRLNEDFYQRVLAT